MVLGLCIVALAAQAQGQRKAGLWEVTSSVTMSGMPAMGNMGSHTQQVCVTQVMIDKYGGPYTSPQNAQCQLTNVSLTANGMTANVVCSGRTSMTGTVQSTFVDANTTKTTMQLNMAQLPNGQSMTMTTNMTFVYQGSDCGNVKPLAMPASQ
jgi:hypothetical protein